MILIAVIRDAIHYHMHLDNKGKMKGFVIKLEAIGFIIILCSDLWWKRIVRSRI